MDKEDSRKIRRAIFGIVFATLLTYAAYVISTPESPPQGLEQAVSIDTTRILPLSLLDYSTDHNKSRLEYTKLTR